MSRIYLKNIIKTIAIVPALENNRSIKRGDFNVSIYDRCRGGRKMEYFSQASDYALPRGQNPQRCDARQHVDYSQRRGETC